MVEINYLAVFVSGIAGVVLGGLWYGPVFGKKWQELAGITPEAMTRMPLTPIQAMIGGLVGAVLMAWVLAHSIAFAGFALGLSGVSAGLQGAFWNWLGFILPVTAGVFLWEGKSWKLFALNATYYLVSLGIMGLIIALWK